MLCLNFPCCSKHAVSSGRVAVVIGEIGFCGGFPSPDTPPGAGSLPWARGAPVLVLLSVWTAAPPPQGKVALVFWRKGNPGTPPNPFLPPSRVGCCVEGPGTGSSAAGKAVVPVGSGVDGAVPRCP